MKKLTILLRLFKEGHISEQEFELLYDKKSKEDIPTWTPSIKNPYESSLLDKTVITLSDKIVTTYADKCSCNPKNGGSGICGCTIANQIIEG